MKTFIFIILLIALIALASSCQPVKGELRQAGESRQAQLEQLQNELLTK